MHPTLYAAFFALNEPFLHFWADCDELSELVQWVINILHPKSNYIIQQDNDPFVNLVCRDTTLSPWPTIWPSRQQARQRISKLQSMIQRQALDDVAAKFQTTEFTGNYVKIQDYCN